MISKSSVITLGLSYRSLIISIDLSCLASTLPKSSLHKGPLFKISSFFTPFVFVDFYRSLPVPICPLHLLELAKFYPSFELFNFQAVGKRTNKQTNLRYFSHNIGPCTSDFQPRVHFRISYVLGRRCRGNQDMFGHWCNLIFLWRMFSKNHQELRPTSLDFKNTELQSFYFIRSITGWENRKDIFVFLTSNS